MAEKPDVHQRLLKEAVAILLHNYGFEEVIEEIREERPAFDIYVAARGNKSKCPCCGFEFNREGNDMACKFIEGQRGQLEVQRLRLDEWEKANHKKPADVKIIMICGNPTCIALEHMRVSASESWAKKKGQPPEVPPPEAEVSNWRLVQIAKSPWLSLTEEENESVVKEVIQLRKAIKAVVAGSEK